MLHPWTNFSKTCTVFLLLFVCQNVQISAEEYTSDPSASSQQVEQQDDKQLQMAKRAWKQLQSGWGKRMNQEPEDPLRMMPNDDYLDNFRSIDYDANALSQGKANLYDNSEDGETLEKRAWKQMNGAWGKREPNWNQFRGFLLIQKFAF